jgi:carbon storage regulator
MLVLTRKLMERLYIGDDVCVTVVRLEGGQVRLGIEAPREVSVVRAELVPERSAETTARRARGDEASGDDAVRRPQVAARGIDIPRPGPFR